MAAQEKLLKSLDVLKNLSNYQNDQSKKKDKIQHCHIITEAISNPIVKMAPNFHTYLSITIEVLLQLCDDQESDIRMVAEECLNRIIRAMNDGNMSKVQIELHKGIKKNGAARSLRAALWRFSQLAHLIRPHKGKPYVVNLFPTVIKIVERNEEQVHETLAISLLKIMQVLGNFASDNEIKLLLKAVLKNVNHKSTAIRRTTASCVLSICLNCRKPYVFITYVISYLLDMLIPINDDQNSAVILGALSCLKSVLPHLKPPNNGKQEIKGSFGVRKEADSSPPAVDKLLQIYEICLNYFSSKDHNIVNSALETLNILLQNCSGELKKILLCQNGLTKSRISVNQSSSLSKLRSPSQLSVATNNLADDPFGESELTETLMTDIEKWIDESKLSVMNVTYAKSRENLEKSLPTDNQTAVDFDNFDYKIHDFAGIKSQSIENNLERLTTSENSSEKSFSYVEDDKCLDEVEISIGSLLDNTVPLIYCARLISKSFLLTGQPGNYQSDRAVRVSVKSLALLCLSSIVKLYPRVLNLYLDKNYSSAKLLAKPVISSQKLSDVLLYEDHSDPQLRGTVRTLISNYIRSVLIENRGRTDDFQSAELDLGHLTEILVKGLQDESSNCSRQTVISLGSMLELLCESGENRCALPILQTLPLLASNPYWLVKVALCEIVAKLPYITIHDLTGSSHFQSRIIFNVLIECLKHDDLRVRNSAATSLVSVIPNLYYEEYCTEETVVTAKALKHTGFYLNILSDRTDEDNSNMKHLMGNMPFPFNKMGSTKADDRTEFALSKIVSKLYSHILTSTSRHFVSGCIETLSILSTAYPTTLYTKAWNCHKVGGILENDNGVCTMDILNFCVNSLRHSVTTYELNFHLNLLNLSANLYSGHAHCFLRPISNVETSQLWDMFSDKKFSNLSKQYLNHMVKLLNIFHHVLDEIQPVPPQTKVLSNLSQATNTLSPIKRRRSDLTLEKRNLGSTDSKDDTIKDRKDLVKSAGFGCFVSLPHYVKIYETLRSAYTNYKISLESEASDKFLGLLRQTLHTLSVLMEVGTLAEFRGVADEILGYCRSTFLFEAASTVQCVQQLLKCLFGTNFTANVTEIEEIIFDKKAKKSVKDPENYSSFYFNVSQKPYTRVAACFNSLKTITKVECDGDSTIMGYLHRKDVSKPTVPVRSSDKVLANYIRIFEPMVIKSLKQYTITSDIKLQCKVLQLLSQLIQLRVNYCLLDSEQIFINFVIKQFEYIEEGQIPFPEELIPKIFQFLVHLSYSKQHSKSIIGIPKIIQLCDGLMASGQSPLTHCIPALEPIVEDIFLTRNKSNTPDLKELETTREVVLSMLLRLSEYHQVIDLIVLILQDSKYCSDDPEKWLRWSGQVINVIFPMLKQNKIRLDCTRAFVSLRRLIFALNPNVFNPIDPVLLLLFKEPLDEDFTPSMCNRWLGKVLIALLILSPLKEDALFAKIEEIKGDFSPGCIFENLPINTVDPLNVLNGADFFSNINSETIFVKALFKILTFFSGKCVETVRINEDDDFIVELLSVLLMYCLHLFQSGGHCKIVNQAIHKHDKKQLEEINKNFVTLAPSYPILTFLWSYFLTLLNYNDKSYWGAVLLLREGDSKLEQSQAPATNLKIVRTGSAILFCDYMSEDNFDSDLLRWFLCNFIDVLIDLCDEAPVSEFISSIHRNPDTSRLFIDNIIETCPKIQDPIFKTKILKCVETTNSLHIGSLLKLLLPKFLTVRQLALSRMAANLASRKIELLLTMSMEDVNTQLAKDDLLEIIRHLVSLKLVKKHEALSCLLNKLCTQYYDISPLEFDQKRPVNPEYIKKLQINKSWYSQQIKAKSVDPKLGQESAELLNRLDYDELYALMTGPDFSKVCFHDCLKSGISQIRQNKVRNSDECVLLKAAIARLVVETKEVCRRIPQPHQVYRPRGGSCSPLESKYEEQFTSLLANDSFRRDFFDLIPSVSCYVSSLPHLSSPQRPDDDFLRDLVFFGVLCLDAVSFIIDDGMNLNANAVDAALNCCDAILRGNERVANVLDSHVSWLCSAVNSLYKFVEFLVKADEPLPDLGPSGIKETMKNQETKSAGRACYQLNVIITWLHKIKDWSNNFDIQKSTFKVIKSVTISLSRLPLVNSYLTVPGKVWRTGWSPELLGPFRTQVPPLPIELLQEVDILEEFVFRMTLLGWTARQQFEETWMCLLSVLCMAPATDQDPAEVNDLVHASSLAVEAITSLLLETLRYPQPGNTVVSELVHVSRDPPIKNVCLSIRKLRRIYSGIENKHSERNYLPKLVSVFDRCNFEKHSPNDLSYGQMSVKYLLIATNNNVDDVEGVDCEITEMWKRRERLLENSGLDVNSCLQFLLDFYTQLLKQSSTPLRLLHEAVRSSVIISELFSDRTQFAWMLETFLELTKTHNYEEQLLHQYLIVGICKSAAVLTPDLETYETIKKMLVQDLKSTFLPARIACLHGILYILEGCKLSNISIGGISDELQLILPCAVEYVQCNLNSSNEVLKRCQEHTMLVWALAFYLVENVDEIHMEANFTTNTLQTAFTVLLQQKPTIILHRALMKGLERLIVVDKSICSKIGKQIESLALEKLKSDNPSISVLGEQLLLTYMYTDCAPHFENSEKANFQSNPDYLVQTIEKLSAIFEHVKKGYVFEIEILCYVLPDIINDFFSPSDVLTKVIGEFLSPQQPHPKLLSKVVFQVFEKAIEQQQLPLLQDWVVFSLSNFTQSLSIGMATWCLTCFFISASSNEWLRLFFPYVQTRVGRYEYEDRKMLCIAGSDFYRNLTNDRQKQTFIENFNKVKDQPDTLFNDLLNSL